MRISCFRYGLFATTSFKQGAIITEYDGKVISRKEAEALRKKEEDTHCRTLNRDYVIDGRLG